MNFRNKKSIEDARRQIIGSSNQSAFPEDNKSDRPIRLLCQDKQVGRTNQSSSYGPSSVSTNQSSSMDHLFISANQILQKDLPTDHISVSANQILRMELPMDNLSVSANHILRTDVHTDLPTDHLSVSANQILRTDLSTDHLSVSANQILRTDFPTDHLSVSANQIVRMDLPTDHLPYRPIRSFIGLSNRYILSQSSESSTRSDGQTLKLKSLTCKSRTLYAQAASSA